MNLHPWRYLNMDNKVDKSQDSGGSSAPSARNYTVAQYGEGDTRFFAVKHGSRTVYRFPTEKEAVEFRNIMQKRWELDASESTEGDKQ